MVNCLGKAMLSVLLIALVVTLGSQAQAAVFTTYTWDGAAVGDNWSTTGNWDIAGDPSLATDEAILPDLGGAYTVLLTNPKTVGQLIIGGTLPSDAPTLDLSSSLTIAPGPDEGTTSSNLGTIDINNTTFYINTDFFTQSGTINASGGTLKVGFGGTGGQNNDVDTVIDWTAGNDITDPYRFLITSAAEVTVNRSSPWDVLSGQTIEFGANTPGSDVDITVLTLDQDMTNSGSIQMGTSSLGYINHFMTINSTDSKITNNSDGLIEMYPRSATSTTGVWAIRRLEAELINGGEFNVFTHKGRLGKPIAGIDHDNTGTITFDDSVLGTNPTPADRQIPMLTVTGASMTNSAAGTIGGNGILDVSALTSGELANNGTLSPGLSAGILNVTGDVINSSTSKLVIELGGTVAGTIKDQDIEFDQLNISGTFAIDGELLVTLINGLENTITNGDSFSIATFGSSSGTFSNLFGNSRVNVPDVFIDGISTSFLVTIDANSIVLSDFGQNPVPEPSSLALLGLGLFGLLGRVRRNRRRG